MRRDISIVRQDETPEAVAAEAMAARPPYPAQGGGGALDGAMGIVRRHPMAAFATAAGLGMLLGSMGRDEPIAGTPRFAGERRTPDEGHRASNRMAGGTGAALTGRYYEGASMMGSMSPRRRKA